jgi:hypothetical protein
LTLVFFFSVSFGITSKHLDARYHSDFRNIQDVQPFFKGGEQYFRPCGWMRFALNVKTNTIDSETKFLRFTD